MNIHRSISFLFLTLTFALSGSGCKSNRDDNTHKDAVLEVAGKFLYIDDLKKIVPPNVTDSDSINLTKDYIRKWVVDVLMYENAKRNVNQMDEIDELVENYRKSLIIHAYQQKLIQQKLPGQPAEETLKSFYNEYSKQFQLSENVVKGLLLVVPSKAPQMANVRVWVQSGNSQSLEKIEKYSLRNAVSYDYFGDRWLTFTEVLKRIPLQVTDPSAYVRTHRFVEFADSTQHYFLRITDFRTVGQVQPYEIAKPQIVNILQNQQKSDFINHFEQDLYKDAVQDETVTFFK